MQHQGQTKAQLGGDLDSLNKFLDLLESMGIEPSKDSEEASQAYTKVFFIQSNGTMWSIRCFLDKRSNWGSIKITATNH